MKIYYTIDEANRVFPTCDWREDIEPGDNWRIGDIGGHAYEEHGVPLYKDVDGLIIARTAEEVQADVDIIPIPEPSPEEILRADVDFLLMLADEESVI